MTTALLKPLVLLLFGGTLLLLAVRRLRQYRLKERYTLLFLFTGLPFLVLAAWPNMVGWLAKRLDIQYGTMTLLCVSAFLILMVFELLTIVSLQDRKITTLAQIVGIMMEKHGLNEHHSPTADSDGHDDAVSIGPRGGSETAKARPAGRSARSRT